MADQRNITSAFISTSFRQALTIADLNTKVNHEPRVADLRLAGALGFTDRHKLRRLIERHRESLERFGIVLTTVEKTSVLSATVAETSKGGRPGKTYWLNKKQALYLCTKSEAPLATETTIQMVEVFDEYLTGSLRPVKVKEHRRSTPGRQPRRFETPAEYALDLLQVARSANHRTMNQPGLSFGAAFCETLEDIIAHDANPRAAKRGVTLDWNYQRASEDLADKLRAEGQDVREPRPRSVPQQEFRRH